jgi:16S rRNA (guanine966-N2)-methyltransferase
MRIIAGRFRSRAIASPRGMATRPTSDRLRETLFNVLAPRMEGAAFLDLYAGSGAVGLEALSRGAKSVVFVERAPAALKALRTNLKTLGLEAPGVERSSFQVYAGSVAGFLHSVDAAGPGPARYDVVFLDPPYDAAGEYEATMGLLGGEGRPPRSPKARDPSTGSRQAPGHPVSLLSSGGVVIAEHRRKEKPAERYGALARMRLLEQGDAALSFYAMDDGE